jgi:integrase
MPGEPVPELGWPGTKNGASHRVWLPAPVRALIGEADSGYVFAGGRGAVLALDKPMRGICKSIGIPRLTPHDLRRTHGSTVTALGFGRDAMNRIQNHREGGIASVCDRHGYADENKRIMEAVAAKIMSLIDGRAADNVVAFR